jgi:hypothetical protein
MKKLILSLSILASFAAHAAGTVTGVVTGTTGGVSGEVYIQSGGTASGTPSCATSNPGRFGIDGTSAGGAAMLREINMAIALGKTIVLTGTGACTLTGNVENLSYFSITW